MTDLFKIKDIRDFGSLISHSFYYLRRHFKLLGKSILYFVVPLITICGLLLFRYFNQVFQTGSSEGVPDELAADFILNILTSSIFGLFAMTALAAVVFNHMKLAADDTISTFDVNDIWDGFKGDFFAIMGISILVYIATMAGIILFVIPGIFIGVKLALTSAVYVLEDTTFGKAFSRSWSLIKDYWWLTFGLLIVMTIMVSLMSYILVFPLGIIAGIAGYSGFENPQAAGTIFGIFYTFVTSLSYLFYTVIYVCLGLHYYNLYERKEGAGLEERINRIDSTSDTNTIS